MPQHVQVIPGIRTFDGPRRNDLFTTATSSLYRLRLNTAGARYPASAPPAS
jgi:hypothetical protein